jgi:serine/threonine-protein kinase
MQQQFAADIPSRSRFLAEAEITGGLEHPGVIPVYGLGQFDDGRPFYAMRFIRGDSLREAIERFHKAEGPSREPGERSLALRRLIGRFLDVCNAVEYAHSRGVLHRDIKPGNVMLGPYGETLVVDWGLAKVVGCSDGAEPTLRPPAESGYAETLPGSVIGTPGYMSPEQARGDLKMLGPACDVYSLGATLYHLLTGRPAFEPANFSELQTQIINGQFAPPHEVNRSVPRALEAVCLKAMAREPDDRYVSPRALADDIEHWLADEPVSARHEPWAVRARRWLARHRTLVTASAAAAAVGLVGLATVVLLQQRANQALRTSNINLLIANTREQNARRLAQTRYALARKAVEAYYTGASEDVLLKQPELEDLRKRLLQTALEFYREMATTLTDSSDNTPATRDELARAYAAVASITQEVGSKEDALAALERVRTILEDLLRAKPEDESLRRRLARCLQLLANVSQSTGRRDEAASTYNRALSLREGLLSEHPDDAALRLETAWVHQNIGSFHQEVGRRADALRSFQQALVHLDEVARLHPDDVACQNSRAGVLHDIGLLEGRANLQDGIRALEKAVELRRRIVHDHPHDDFGLRFLARSCNDLAGLFWRSHRFDEALGHYQEALALNKDLARRHPTVNELRWEVATAHYNIGLVHGAANRLNQARESLRAALSIREAMVQAHASIVSYQLGLSDVYFQLGYVHRRLGHLDQAISWYGKALPLQKDAHRAQPDLTNAISGLGWTYNNLGYLQLITGRIAEALQSYEQSLKFRQQLVESDRSALAWRRDLAWSYRMLSEVQRELGDLSGAREAIDHAIAISESLVREHANDPALRRSLTEVQLAGVALSLRFQQTTTALETARRVASESEDDYRRNPSEPGARTNVESALILLGNAQLAVGDSVAAQRSYEKVMALMESLARLNDTELARLCRVYSLQTACPAPGGPPATPEGDAARRALADRAVQTLRQAISAGYHEVNWVRTEPDLDALRTRGDFQALVADMVFPADAFAH